MDIKLLFAIISTVIAIIAFIPYLKDMFSRKTKPHAYTWLIWSITQGTAAAAMWFGGGGIAALGLTIGVVMVFGIFLLSLKYGTRNIKKSDTIVLILAICAIFIWWQLHQPLISVILVSLIDFSGYFPSFRKSFQEPWSETLTSWILFSVSDIFIVLALKEYNFLTLTYITTIASANIVLFLICLFRRKYVKKPNLK